ncbi:MAG: PilZ domain-containing protein [Thermoanaerobaculia bacterium]
MTATDTRRPTFREPHSGFNRVPFIQTCTIDLSGVLSSGLICNLSILGVYLHLEVPLEVGREVNLIFRLPDDGAAIEAHARVCWSNDVPPTRANGLPLGCGLRFLRVAPDDLRRIALLVADFLVAPQDQVQLGVGQPYTGRLRIPFITSCTLTGKFGTRHGSVCNLSIVGVYVAVRELPAAGARGRIAFALPGEDGAFDAEFKVVWQNPDFPHRVHALPPGCGLLFEALPERERDLLSDFVQDYLQAVVD